MKEDEVLTQVIANLERTLSSIQDKLRNAHVLNGGFDRLMERIQNIEDTQSKILGEVEYVKKTIYDPDNGIYSRIKDGDAAVEESVHLLDKKIIELKLNCDSDTKMSIELEEIAKKNLHLIEKDIDDMQLLRPKVEEFERWKSHVNKSLFAVAIPLVTTLAKILYDFFSTHLLVLFR